MRGVRAEVPITVYSSGWATCCKRRSSGAEGGWLPSQLPAREEAYIIAEYSSFPRPYYSNTVTAIVLLRILCVRGLSCGWLYWGVFSQSRREMSSPTWKVLNNPESCLLQVYLQKCASLARAWALLRGLIWSAQHSFCYRRPLFGWGTKGYGLIPTTVHEQGRGTSKSICSVKPCLS